MVTVNTFNIGNIDLPGDGYPSLSAFNIPVTSGLMSALFLGDGASLISDDFAPGAPVASISGSPVSVNGYTSLSGVSFIETGAAETTAITLFVIARKVNATESAAFIGDLVQATPGGIGIYSNANASSVTGNASREGAPAGQTASVAAVPTDWGMYALVCPATGQFRLTNLKTGSGASSPATEARAIRSEKIRVGGINYASIQGATQVCLALVFNRAISDTERDALAVWARGYAAEHGITV